MSAVLLTPCFLEGRDDLGNPRFDRNAIYAGYYHGLREEMGFDKIYFLDNASDRRLIRCFSESAPDSAIISRYDERLEKGPGKHDYTYCWRVLYDLGIYLDFYDKIIVADSDGFVLTRRLSKYIKDCNTGWVSFKSSTHDFPEASLQILNKDALLVYTEYTKTPWQQRLGATMEKDIPFTHVEDKFNVGRFGELGAPPQEASMDWYGQTPVNVILEYGKFE